MKEQGSTNLGFGKKKKKNLGLRRFGGGARTRKLCSAVEKEELSGEQPAMAANSSSPAFENFRLFASVEDEKSNPGLGIGFLDSQQPSLPPPPPCLEVISSEVSSSVKYKVEPVSVGGLTMFKGRVSTQEVFSLSNSDLVPGEYEGGLKLWEGALDLVKALCGEVENGHLSFAGKRVLEIGCGHGLPGIYACLEDAAAVHFQDFNAEVLRCLTIPNVTANLSKMAAESEARSEVRYFAGDWSEMHKILPFAPDNVVKLSGSCDPGQVSGYDIVLMAETVYSLSTLKTLYKLITQCLSRPHGVVYLAGKKHYFGVGGGTRRFLSVLEKEGEMVSKLIAEVADGSSNVREVWKLSLK
ncbi:histidine protein methyltransferase 1 homolog [Momordica charantia]|uniref:protein-histidine N-methyltransferase n=1 Tax=Momordica charantia TaxID=3673 RepID=A0A6J1C961_MOMCH|nr:histidine protein methyltransferase 1 homolog [Momordica charantia]XP_022138236.1 histidine protein methyltransferase 1 homolog [Momordica charantia]